MFTRKESINLLNNILQISCSSFPPLTFCVYIYVPLCMNVLNIQIKFLQFHYRVPTEYKESNVLCSAQLIGGVSIKNLLTPNGFRREYKAAVSFGLEETTIGKPSPLFLMACQQPNTKENKIDQYFSKNLRKKTRLQRSKN